MTPHAKLRKEICDWLAAQGAWYCTPHMSGYGRKGIPDILCCLNGNFYAFEVKCGKDRPNPWQRREIEAIRVAHGNVFVAYSLDALCRWLGRPAPHALFREP